LYKLTNVRMLGNEHGGLAPDTIYAELREEDGTIVIGATLPYILKAIRDRHYQVDGVTVSSTVMFDGKTSVISLDKYPTHEYSQCRKEVAADGGGEG